MLKPCLSLTSLTCFIILSAPCFAGTAATEGGLPLAPPLYCGKSTETLQARRPLAQQIIPVLLESIDRGFPHGASYSFGVFGDGFDWHSSVHAHWALLSMARILGDKVTQDKVLARLTPDALEKQRDYLANNPNYELPYGQAWLLLMLAELKKTPAKFPDSAALLERETQARVLQWLEGYTLPENRDGRCRGDYYSWILSYRLAKQAAALSGTPNPRIDALAKKAATPECFTSTPEGLDFIDPAAVAAINAGKPFTGKDALDSINNLGWVNINNCHKVGVAISRAWPSAVASHKGDPQACQKFDAVIHSLTTDTDPWKDGFQSVSHWIPQLVWYGIWEELGEP